MSPINKNPFMSISSSSSSNTANNVITMVETSKTQTDSNFRKYAEYTSQQQSYVPETATHYVLIKLKANTLEDLQFIRKKTNIQRIFQLANMKSLVLEFSDIRHAVLAKNILTSTADSNENTTNNSTLQLQSSSNTASLVAAMISTTSSGVEFIDPKFLNLSNSICATLLLSGFPRHLSDAEAQKVFNQFGVLWYCQRMDGFNDNNNNNNNQHLTIPNRCKTTFWLEFYDSRDTAFAQSQLDGIVFHGNQIACEFVHNTNDIESVLQKFNEKFSKPSPTLQEEYLEAVKDFHNVIEIEGEKSLETTLKLEQLDFGTDEMESIMQNFLPANIFQSPQSSLQPPTPTPTLTAAAAEPPPGFGETTKDLQKQLFQTTSNVNVERRWPPTLHETKITKTAAKLSVSSSANEFIGLGNVGKTQYNTLNDFAQQSQTFVPSENQLNYNVILSGKDKRTTFMIRNIPNKYTQQMLIDLVNETHRGKYDFLYLRMDFKNKCNVGYAFINFPDPKDAATFARRVSGKRWRKFNSDKVCMMSYANIQGKEALVAKFRDSQVMLEDESYRPKLFDNEGNELAFPAPLKNILQQQQQRAHSQQEKQEQQMTSAKEQREGADKRREIIESEHLY